MQSYNAGKDLTLVPNDKYWGAKPHLDSIVYHFITDSSQQVPALQNKEVDMIYPQPQLDQVNATKQITDVNSEINFGPQFEHIDLNVKTPGLDDLVVRQAIATAIDRPKLVQRTVAQFSSKAKILNNRMFVTNQPEYKDTSAPMTRATRPRPRRCWRLTATPSAATASTPRQASGCRSASRAPRATPCG